MCVACCIIINYSSVCMHTRLRACVRVQSGWGSDALAMHAWSAEAECNFTISHADGQNKSELNSTQAG